MKQHSAMMLAPVLLAAAVLPSAAQGLSATYKVEFRIKDGSDAAAKNGRRYMILIDTTGHGSFHVGDRVPMATGVGGGNTQFQYYDIGVNIDTKLQEVQQGKLMVNATLDLSTVHKADPAVAPGIMQPTVSQIKIVVDAMVSPGKPTLVASIDDPATERKFEVEAVVTKVE